MQVSTVDKLVSVAISAADDIRVFLSNYGYVLPPSQVEVFEALVSDLEEAVKEVQDDV